MKKSWVIFGIAALAVIALIFAFAGQKTGEQQKDNAPQDENTCNSDSDCVKDSCCHASGCVAIGNAPKCSGILCSQECSPGTLDCGQGSCLCINNRCEVSLNG